MLKSIRFRLGASFVGIALLVVLLLGTVLLVSLRSYYAGLEQAYLEKNARTIGNLAQMLLSGEYTEEIRTAQLEGFAFLSKARVRILDSDLQVLADSGPWQRSDVGIGVLQPQEVSIAIGKPDMASVIILKDQTAILENTPQPSVSIITKRNDNGEFLYFSDIAIGANVYGYDLGDSPVDSQNRSDQVALIQIPGSKGEKYWYVELSEGPAYGEEIVRSVAISLAIAGGVALLVAILAGWLVSRFITAPLLNLTDATLRMSNGDLTVRVKDTGRGDEFGTLGRSFNQMVNRVEETILNLQRFLADAAHGLQTPLTSLHTDLELALSEKSASRRQDYLKRTLEQVDRLEHLNNSLLDLSRLENTPAQSEFREVDMIDLLQQACEPFAAQADQKRQSFSLDLPGILPKITANPQQLQAVLVNLLDNAIKFTPEGGSIMLGARPLGDKVRLWVEDSGIGIPVEDMGRLFTRFFRGRNAAGYPGNGLGLAICQLIIQAHGGDIRAENISPSGARFTVCLPVEQGNKIDV